MAEDNEINREILGEMLGGYCDVHFAVNGKEAVDLFRERPGGYDMILMDIHMPVMDGYEAAARIRALHSNVPIIAVTANNQPEDGEKREYAGMNGFVGKPVDLEPLLETVLRWV